MAIDFRSTSLDSMGEADWISAALYCNRSTFNRMRRVAIKAGLLEGAGARDIRMGTVSEIAQYQRARDPERMADFNASIAEWQRITIGSLRANPQRLGIGKGELYESLRPTTHKNKYGEIDRIGFSFARQGIYIHKGAYRGFGGYKGSRWSYRKATKQGYIYTGEMRTTNPSSIGKLYQSRMKARDWFNPVIERRIERLAEICAAYSADMAVDASRIFIKD